MTLEALYATGTWIAVLAYLALNLLFIVTWARKQSGKVALIASILTTLHLVSLALTSFSFATLALETLALLAWITLLASLLGLTIERLRDPALRYIAIVLSSSIALGASSIALAWSNVHPDASSPVSHPPRFAADLLIVVAGLVLVEQLMLNVRAEERWRLRYLAIGLGTIFLFSLLANATGLLFGTQSTILIALEPAVFALAAPCLAVAIWRNLATPMQLSLSRQIVFRVGTLISAGVALLVLGIFGYLLQLVEGDWRLALVTLITVAALMGAAVVFGSSTMRSRGRRLIAEHLFPHKYDYRDEWLRVTRQLTEPHPDYDLPQQVIRVLGRIVLAEGGAIWVVTEPGSLHLLGQLNAEWDRPLSAATGGAFSSLFSHNERSLDLRTTADRDRLSHAVLEDLQTLADLRFVVPLMTESRLVGVVGLKNPPIPHRLDWEDQDLLRLVAREASGIVALRAAERALAEADKLHGFHQISAFIIHDVKTIASQLSLLMRNAEKHKHNPAFIDDMIKTLANSVQRINRLMEQLREERIPNQASLDLSEQLEDTLVAFHHQRPAPSLALPEEKIEVLADRDQLASAIGHLVQNAIDAAAANTAVPQAQRCVRVSLRRRDQWAEIHIEDSGAGMDRTFVETRLFQPFTSTKGVAGLGIGAYQAKAYLRSLGGDVNVTSTPGQGSHFILRLPMEHINA